ncbi:Dynein heavy chain 10, axonemal [Rhizophlyctis rosea]|nr:Dynein heavy chain 10, axonemal [Rhizophlyctis rosea]
MTVTVRSSPSRVSRTTSTRHTSTTTTADTKTPSRTNPPALSTAKPTPKSIPTIPSVLSQPKQPQIPFLPNELILSLLEHLPTKTLLTTRLVSRRFRRLSNLVLSPRIESSLTTLEQQRQESDAQVRETEITKRPMLRHYRQWLRNASSHEVTEATWYAKPPEELKVVCECLCILKGVKEPRKSSPSPPSSSSTSEEDPLSWHTIRKTMSLYSFKTWLTSLRTQVDQIPYPAIQRVEQIIISNPLITYERLREVSTAGYNLLILVAACLQYCAIAEELKRQKAEFVELDRGCARLEMFLSALEGDDAAVAIIAQAAKL